MKVRAIRSLGKGLPDFREGQEYEVKDEIGKQLCERGLCECLDPPPEIKAVPNVPEIKAVPEEPEKKPAPSPRRTRAAR